MHKIQFLTVLRQRLSDLAPADMEEQLNFYREMIEDRMEDGLSEEEAVADVGDVEQIAAQILQENAPEKITKAESQTKRKWKAWEIVLLALGSPIWLSLLIAAFAVILVLYISWWAVVISLWSVFASLVVTAVGIVVAGVIFACSGNGMPGLATIGAGLICAGLTVFLFYGCKAVTQGTVWITKKICLHRKDRVAERRDSHV